MLHPHLTPLTGPSRWLAEIGAWSDLSFTVRYGDGPCGMFEAEWSMPLPRGFADPALVRGTRVELMNSVLRVGSSLYIADVQRGDGYSAAWKITAAGLGRAATSGYYALDSAGNASAVPSVAATAAMAPGRDWAIAGIDSSVSSVAYGQDPPDAVNTLGDLLDGSSTSLGQRWGVGQDDILKFYDPPTQPEYMTAPGVGGLGTSDDEYATLVIFRYLNSASGKYESVTAPATPPRSSTVFGHKELLADGTALNAMSTAEAQSLADAVYDRAKGRLSWLSPLTLSRNDVLTMGGAEMDPLKFAEDAARGTMLRIHGDWSDLLAYTGNTYVDVIIGEVKKDDATDAITVSPLGLTPTDLAGIVESLTKAAA